MKIRNTRNWKPDHLPDFFVWWDTITYADLDGFRKALDNATCESDMQAYIEANPLMLIQHLGGGHGRWVIDQKRLGAEHVPDFVIADRNSLGYEWKVVEIESPKAAMFTKAGDPSSKLNHAIRQIIDWRSWLKRNQDYASRIREKGGLGLIDIDSNVKGLIIIDRRNRIDDSTHERRRQLSIDLNIEIHTYDWLIERALGRLKSLEK